MNPVQQPNPPKVDIKPLMMAIMLLRRAVEKVIATVHRRRLNQLPRNKQPERQHMHAQHNRRHHNRQRVRDDMLHRVRILRGKGHRRRELVVRLMNASVQGTPVQQPVGVVEHDLAGQDTNQNVARDLGRRWERRVDPDPGLATGRVGRVHEPDVESHDEHLVAHRDGDGPEDLAGCGLFGRGLDLVSLGKGRRDVVERDEEDARQPPEDDLHDEAADEVDVVVVMGRHEVLPQSSSVARHHGHWGCGGGVDRHCR